MTYQYDLAGRRTRATWSDGFFVTYERMVTGEVSAIREYGSGLLASYSYNDRGQRTSLLRGNGGSTSYGYDAVGRLASLTHDLAGSANDVTTNFSYTPASQIASLTRSNTGYAWTQHYTVDRSYAVNVLNQVTSAGGLGFGYDGRGNLTSSGSTTYSYDAFNLLRSSNNGMSAHYDSTGRLLELNQAVSTRFFHDGSQIAAEVANPTGAIQRRYVWGDGADDLIVWYEGGGTSDRRWAVRDERGSVVAYADNGNAAIAINRYDEYGIPQSSNIGRFQYTGQAWLPEIGLYYYKARIYSPTMGRFLQTDPIGYGDGMNIYAYVGNDPVNKSDPTGLCGDYDNWVATGEIICSERVWPNGNEGALVRSGGGGSGSGSSNSSGGGGLSPPAVPAAPQSQPAITPATPDCNWAIDAGNFLGDISNQVTKAALPITAAGGVMMMGGIIFAQPVILGNGIVLASAGSAASFGAAALQITGGILQAFGGGPADNMLNGIMGLATSVALGRAVTGPAPRGYRTVSQRQSDSTSKLWGLATGVGWDVATSPFIDLGAKPVSCKRKD